MPLRPSVATSPTDHVTGLLCATRDHSPHCSFCEKDEITPLCLHKVRTMQVGFKSISDNMVTQKVMEWRTARGAEDRKRTDDAFVDLRTSTVSRNEWSERNHARDTEITELSRRIEELRQEFGSQYTARDVLLSTQSEVKDLRNQLRRLYESSG